MPGPNSNPNSSSSQQFFPTPKSRMIQRSVVAGATVAAGLVPYLFSSNRSYNALWFSVCAITSVGYFCMDTAREACRATRTASSPSV
jgi:hypothetical protein